MTPKSKLQKNEFSCRNQALSCRKVHFPAATCAFVLKMHIPAEKMRFSRAHSRKPQEIAGGFQSSRIKNASQLSQDKYRFSAELEKLEKGGSIGKKNTSKKPWASIFTLSPCRNRCCFSESAIFLSQVHPPLKIK